MSSTSGIDVNVLPGQRALFDIPEDVTYLNCAFMAPLMHAVVRAGEHGIRRKQHPWEITPPDFFELPNRGRDLFARLIGAEWEHIAVVPSVSYGIGTAAYNLDIQSGQEIVLLADQFPSNVYPWREKARTSGGKIITIPRPPAGESWTNPVVEAIGPDTAVLALPHCHWTDGSLLDLAAIGRAARAVGAALVIDATQSLGAMPFDVQAIKPDYLVAASYKWLLGPYSMGFMYVAPQRRNDRPLEHGWAGRKGAEDFARLVDYQDEFGPGMRRMDVGEFSQFHLMPMAIAAMEQILAWGVESIARSLAYKTAEIAERATAMGLQSVPAHLRAGHFLGLRFPGGVPDGLLDHLAARRVYASVRGDSMRVTPHLYNTQADIDRLFNALESVPG